jgi:uncharacterized SAM-binding protein YcdF (DUF218 family)
MLLIGAMALAAVFVLAAGFLYFADGVARARPPGNPAADAIVALTGGAGRIEDAVTLLARGSASRLLISGVNERTSATALAGRSPRLAGFMSCCVDIGYEALDTRGNALEAAKWARQRGYDSLIVVTSAYHMPRSLAEMARVLPNVRLIPYPVTPDGQDFAGWPTDGSVFKLLVAEYLKFIVARFA